jgi:hypothetical protein
LFPVILEISNTTTEKFHSGIIYPTPKAHERFYIPVSSLNPGDTTKERVMTSVYDVTYAKNFSFEGTCGKNTTWKANNTNS